MSGLPKSLIYIVDDYLTPDQCERLINMHNVTPQDKDDESHPFWKGRTWNLDRLDDDIMVELMCAGWHLEEGLGINGVPEPWQLVHWAAGQSMPLHRDYAQGDFPFRDWAAVIYLNDEYQGGQTFFRNGAEIEPRAGRLVFFKGGNIPHGVREVEGGSRWTAITWYRDVGRGDHA